MDGVSAQTLCSTFMEENYAFPQSQNVGQKSARRQIQPSEYSSTSNVQSTTRSPVQYLGLLNDWELERSVERSVEFRGTFFDIPRNTH